MSHYDLYAALSIDRAADTQTLAAELDRRIAVNSGGGSAVVEELRTARAVLGDPIRRALYDRQLDNPTAPRITVDAVRELAALPVGDAGSGQAAPAPGSTPDTAVDTSADSSSNSSWTIPALVSTVVVGVVVVLVTWGIASGGEDPVAETFTETPPAVTETVTETFTETPEPTAKKVPPHDAEGHWEKEPGNYGVGTDARTMCNARSQAQAVFVAGSDGNCESAVDLADFMHSKDPDTGSVTEWTTYSHEQEREIDVHCSVQSDGDDFPYWYCDAEGEAAFIIYL